VLTQSLLNVSCRYRICSEVLELRDRHPCVAYGIEAISEDDGATICNAVKGISTDRTCVDRMVEKFNRFHLLPIHLADAVEDMMA
jgi:hypothetical protein